LLDRVGLSLRRPAAAAAALLLTVARQRKARQVQEQALADAAVETLQAEQLDSLSARRARVAAIVAAATVRVALGQSAQHELTPSGQHRVSIHGRTAEAPTLQGAIDKIREQQP